MIGDAVALNEREKSAWVYTTEAPILQKSGLARPEKRSGRTWRLVIKIATYAARRFRNLAPTRSAWSATRFTAPWPAVSAHKSRRTAIK